MQPARYFVSISEFPFTDVTIVLILHNFRVYAAMGKQRHMRTCHVSLAHLALPFYAKLEK